MKSKINLEEVLKNAKDMRASEEEAEEEKEPVGNFPAIENQVEEFSENPTMRTALIESMRAAGIDCVTVAAALKEGLGATTMKYASHMGVIMDERETKDWNGRAKFAKLILDVLGITGQKSKMIMNQQNTIFYKSHLRKNSQPIEVKGPDTEIGRRRLQANSRNHVVAGNLGE